MKFFSLLCFVIVNLSTSIPTILPIKESYIVTFKKGIKTKNNPLDLPNVEYFEIGEMAGAIVKTDLTKSDLKNHKAIKSVEYDDNVFAEPINLPVIKKNKQNQNQIQWGLLRINSENIPDYKKNNYDPPYKGKGVDIYVLDTGVMNTHVQFKKNRVLKGYNSISKNTKTNDKNGHGTHVSSTVIGTTMGVSNEANVVPVKVLNDGGSGSWSGVIKGIEWSINNIKKTKRCSIISMSLGGGKNNAMNNAVEQAFKNKVPVIAAAGNNNGNSCFMSPASAKDAITVGSMTKSDFRSSFSNYGKCTDIFGPGSSILGAGISSNTALITLSGTSMATPHVAGVLAQLFEKNGCNDIKKSINELKSLGVNNKLKNIPKDTPNLLLQIPKDTRTPRPTATPRPTTKSPTQSPTPRPTRHRCISICSQVRGVCRCRLNDELKDNGCKCKWKNKKCRAVL